MTVQGGSVGGKGDPRVLILVDYLLCCLQENDILGTSLEI